MYILEILKLSKFMLVLGKSRTFPTYSKSMSFLQTFLITHWFATKRRKKFCMFLSNKHSTM